MSELDDIYEEAAAEPYLPENRPDAQPQIEGVPIQPKLRYSFDVTDNADRPAQEVDDWWCRPFIVLRSLFIPDASYDEYRERMGDRAESREDYDLRIAGMVRSFHRQYPDGIAYEVRCLDGGAWDRSTWWGQFATLPEAVECARGMAGSATIRSGLSWMARPDT